MDANKLNKLREIGYTIRKCCGRCRHADLNVNGWGTCTVHFYDHKKHEGGNKSSTRELSIHQDGYCDRFLMCIISDLETDHFKEFYE
jgi:hypothetical protein